MNQRHEHGEGERRPERGQGRSHGLDEQGYDLDGNRQGYGGRVVSVAATVRVVDRLVVSLEDKRFFLQKFDSVTKQIGCRYGGCQFPVDSDFKIKIKIESSRRTAKLHPSNSDFNVPMFQEIACSKKSCHFQFQFHNFPICRKTTRPRAVSLSSKPSQDQDQDRSRS